jgi:DNA-binding CsgD family transcriptional regulator
MVVTEKAALELFCWNVAGTYVVHVDDGYPADLNELGQYLAPDSQMQFERIAHTVEESLLDPTLKACNAGNLTRWQRVSRIWVVGSAAAAIPRMIDVLQQERMLIEEGLHSYAFRFNHPRDAPCNLTSSELEVLEQIAAGLSDAEVAECLKLSQTAVHKRASRVCRKLGARNRVSAVVAALQLGLLEL